jgi:prepilin-type N-terminal cleavage/methylation domain-containing protein
MSRQRHGEKGFTLLEILVGLLVSVLIMTGLTAAMRSMNRGWQATVDSLGRQDLFANGLNIVAGDLARIERMANAPENGERFLFLGGPSETIFLLSERQASNRNGLYWVRLFVRSDDTRTDLVRMRAPFESRDQDLASVDWQDPVILLGGRTSISFAYRAPRGGFTAWTPSWDMANRLPEQIRVSLLDPDTGEPLLPALVQALANNAEADCVDPKQSGCTIQTKGELVPKSSNE